MPEVVLTELSDFKAGDRDWFFRTARNMASRACGQQLAHRADEAESWAIEKGWKVYRTGQPRAVVAYAMQQGCLNYLRYWTGHTGKRSGYKDALREGVPLTLTMENGDEIERPGMSYHDRYFEGAETLLGLIESANVREMIRLYAVEGYTYEEIGPKMNCSQSHAYKQIKEALKVLRVALTLVTFAVLTLCLCQPVPAANTVSVITCKHHAAFQAFLDRIPGEYTRYGSTHWTAIEYAPKLWPYACKAFGATGDPKTFTGVTFLEKHIILIKDDPDYPALGTFIHECGHALLWPAVTDITFPEFQAETDALFQHEYDVLGMNNLGRDSLPTDAAVQEAWCEELRHTETPGDTVTPWARSYFDQLFSQAGPFPPLMPVPVQPVVNYDDLLPVPNPTESPAEGAANAQ